MSKSQKPVDAISAETQFPITIGGKVYTINFSTKAFIRIQEARPSLPTPFQAAEEMALYELIPFLIDCAINPEDKDWTSFDQFLDIYEDCEDPALEKVVPGYYSAASKVAKKLGPAVIALQKFGEKSAK